MENEKIIDEYIRFIKYERNLSDNTIKTYSNRLDIINVRLKGKKFIDLTTNDVRDCLNDIARLHSVASRNYSLICFNNIFKYMCDNGYISTNPAKGIPSTKTQHKERRSLSINDLNRFFDAVDDNIRDKTLFRLMVETGVRVSEACNLLMDDVDLENGFIHITNGKGNKERYIPIVFDLIPYIKKYLEWRKDSVNEYFFVDRNTFKKINKNITRIAVFNILNKAAEKIGFPKDMISPHVLRHTFATLNLCKGLDLYILSNVMGHSSINTTQIYAKSNKYRNKALMENINIFEH